MQERELNKEETKAIYEKTRNLEPYEIEYEDQCAELYYEIEGKKYRLIYDQDCNWFCDIAYEGDY